MELNISLCTENTAISHMEVQIITTKAYTSYQGVLMGEKPNLTNAEPRRWTPSTALFTKINKIDAVW